MIIDDLHFDLQYQTALDIKSPDSEHSSERTLSRFRTDLARYELRTGADLVKEECSALSEQFAQIMGLLPLRKTHGQCHDRFRHQAIVPNGTDLCLQLRRDENA